MSSSYTETLAALSSLQSQPLSIIRLSESISSTLNSAHDNSNTTANPRTSDISLDNEPSPTPASLAADVSHYRDLFSKLRFSYLEQATKEKFLRAIVGDPPLVVGHTENIELESQLKEIKAVLKEQKEMVARMVEELEGKGRELARRYEGVREGKDVLEKLPKEIKALEDGVRRLSGEIEAKLESMGGALGGAGVGVEGIEEVVREKEMQREEVER
ncbi:MAG: hypothetical protein Q9181_007912, partial [Wetmoreana brouardii]